MANLQSAKQLAKFLEYILARRPDEFGLVPDESGFIKLKTLLKAVNEEEGWRHVRQGAVKEVVFTLPSAPVEIVKQQIRAKNRKNLPPLKHPELEALPKLLYTCVRRKAHSFVAENGISPLGDSEHVIMSSDKNMAKRLGRRIDQEPLMLTVQVEWAVNMGVLFQQFGETLFLARSVPVGAFIAPPLPKEQAEPAKKEGKAPQKPKKPKTPGSFFLELEDPDEKRKQRRKKKKKEISRDRERRNQRRQKEKGWGV